MSADVVLMSDPRVTSIPVVDCGEPLVELDGAEFRLGNLKLTDDRAFAYARTGLTERLRAAADAVPDGVELLIVECWRPPSLQREYFESYRDELRATGVSDDEAELHALASRYVSPPDIAPHSAGAAVDLTLVDAEGNELDLGTPINASPEESDGRCYTDADVPPEARYNRDVLSAAMIAAGFVNYPTEWWHWSYGDRYWAMATGAAHATYGIIDRDGSR